MLRITIFDTRIEYFLQRKKSPYLGPQPPLVPKNPRSPYLGPRKDHMCMYVSNTIQSICFKTFPRQANIGHILAFYGPCLRPQT